MPARAPRIAVNNGYCFAGNAVLFGFADITIATKDGYIGMGGPAMIEGGGLGAGAPTDVGPMDVQTPMVWSIADQDEAHATAMTKQVLGYFQGALKSHDCESAQIAPCHSRRQKARVRHAHAIEIRQFHGTAPRHGAGMITGFCALKAAPLG